MQTITLLNTNKSKSKNGTYYLFIGENEYKYTLLQFFLYMTNKEIINEVVNKIKIGLNTYPYNCSDCTYSSIIDCYKYLYMFLDDDYPVHKELMLNALKKVVEEKIKSEAKESIYDFYVECYNNFLNSINLYTAIIEAIKRCICSDNSEKDAIDDLKQIIITILNNYKITVKKCRASITNYFEMLYITFQDFLNIKVCDNCGNFFIPKRSDSKYCYDEFLESGKSCYEYVRSKNNRNRNYPEEIKKLDRERVKLNNDFKVKSDDPRFMEISQHRKKLMEEYKKSRERRVIK